MMLTCDTADYARPWSMMLTTGQGCSPVDKMLTSDEANSIPALPLRNCAFAHAPLCHSFFFT